MRELTERQRKLLEFIEAHLEEHGYPPSIREMAEAMGIHSTNGVNDHLKALERKGLIARDAGPKSRAITVMRPRRAGRRAEPPGIPVLGRVAAGLPLLAEENLEGHLQLERDVRAQQDGVFALRVRGDSMQGAGILDGDHVLVRPQATARPGEIVVALIDGEATVKTFRPSGQGLTLEAANPAFAPIVVRADEGRDVRLCGVVVGVLRLLK
ncbi:MAG TPA: transcriptional repressor LexA [Myxococcota bacterium]|nr:transcriptional repressor LexA [Myxococcota bacterium]HRY95080.1 transcriptional repressor LexA [Myxococcota bacterium]HSA24481.1 transcriptional repressor LexA [Myxococcota bacterium]